MPDIPPGGFYNAQNPPTDPTTAIARLDELELAIENIHTQLDHADPDEWKSDGDYIHCKDRALLAAASFRVERRYIFRYLTLLARDHGSESEYKDLAAWVRPYVGDLIHTGVSRSIFAYFANLSDEMADKISEKYRHLYDENNPPPSVEVAEERREDLLPLLPQFRNYYRELYAAAANIQLGRNFIPILAKPLYLLEEEIRQELALLKRYVQVNGQVARNDWMYKLLQLVERGVSGRLLLDEEEATIVLRIRTKLTSLSE